MDDFEAVDVEERRCGKCSIIEGGIQCCLSAPPRGYVCAGHVGLLNHLDGVPSGTRQEKRIEIARERRAKRARMANQYALILATNRNQEECKQHDDQEEGKHDNESEECKHDNDQDDIEQRITELRRSIIHQRHQFYQHYTQEKGNWVAERDRLIVFRGTLLEERATLLAERETLLMEKTQQDTEHRKQQELLLKEKTQLELKQDALHVQNKQLESEKQHLQSLHEKAHQTIVEQRTQIETQEAKLKKQHACFQEHDLCIRRLSQENTHLQAHCAVLQAKLASEQQTAWEKWNHAQNQVTLLHTQLAKQNIELEYTKCQLKRKTPIEITTQEQVQQAKQCWVCKKPSHVGQCSVH